MRLFAENSLKYKDDSYKDEGEYKKVVHTRDNSLKFQEVSGILKPYIEFKLPISTIKKIVIGPCQNKELSSKSLELFLKQEKLTTYDDDNEYEIIKTGGVEVIISKVPYRSTL